MNQTTVQKGLVTVIVPAFNSEKYIEKCLSSILRQTYQNLEVIVVDDGSTDRTTGIVRRFAEGDPRVSCCARKTRGHQQHETMGWRKQQGNT